MVIEMQRYSTEYNDNQLFVEIKGPGGRGYNGRLWFPPDPDGITVYRESLCLTSIGRNEQPCG
jgi:hypothetical protein